MSEENKQYFGKIELKKANIPIPSEAEDKRNGIYKWGYNNLYPQYLNYLYKNSAIHGGIISAKVHYTVSGGLTYEGADQESWKKFYSNLRSDYNLDEVVEKFSLDLELSNRFILKGKWDASKSFVEKIEWIDYETARNHIDGNLYVSEDWSDRKENIKIYEPLDLLDRGREFYLLYEVQPKQALLTKGSNKLSKGVYPTPPYSGGIRAIETGIEINESNLSEVLNFFSNGSIVNMNNGIPDSKEDRDNILKELKAGATGSGNTGGMFVSWNNGKDEGITIENLNGNNLPDRYANAEENSTNNVLQSHSVTAPILFGVKTEGSLGNATEMLNGYYIMKNNYFKNRQKAILSVLNYVGRKCNGLQGRIEFNDVEIETVETTPEPQQEVTLRVEQSADEKLSKEQLEFNLIEELSNCGVDKSTKKLVHSYNFINVEDQDNNILETFKKDCFAELTETQLRALAMIKDDATPDTIKTELKLSSKELADLYAKLLNSGLIDEESKLTRAGLTEVARSEVESLQVLYSYELRSDAPALVEGGKTRPFCKTLLGLNRFYTRAEIDLISARKGYNVFSFKGGWYHNPTTGLNEPFCRHTWKSNIVFG